MKALRNPIRFHGEYTEGRKLYVPVPFALERDPNVDMKGFRVAGAIFGNAENWEVSVASLAAAIPDATEKSVRAGIDNLLRARWLAREAIGRNRYVLHVARIQPFSDEDHGRLNTYEPSSGSKRGPGSAVPSGVRQVHGGPDLAVPSPGSHTVGAAGTPVSAVPGGPDLGGELNESPESILSTSTKVTAREAGGLNFSFAASRQLLATALDSSAALAARISDRAESLGVEPAAILDSLQANFDGAELTTSEWSDIVDQTVPSEASRLCSGCGSRPLTGTDELCRDCAGYSIPA